MKPQVIHPTTTRLPLSGWALALDRLPVFLSVLMLFLCPYLVRVEGLHPLLPERLLARVVVFGLLAVYAFQCVRLRKVVWLQAPFWFPLALLGAWMVASALLSPYPVVSSQALGDGVLPFIWFTLLFLLFRELWRIENLLIAFLAGAFGMAVMLLGQRVGFWDGLWQGGVFREFAGRWVGFSGDPRFLSGYFLVAWPLALALLLRAEHAFSRIWWSLTLASLLSAILWTQSRSGWVGLFVGASVFAWVNLRSVAGHSSRWRWASLGFLLLVLCATPFTPTGGRLSSALSAGDPGRLYRGLVWDAALDMARDRGLAGVGYGAFGAALPSYRSQGLSLREATGATDSDHARNVVLEWAAETGWVGLVLALAFWIAVVSPWWKLTWGNAVPRPLGAAAFAVFAGVFAAGLLEDTYTQVTTLYPLLFVAAMPAALTQRFHGVDGSPIRLRVWDPGRAFPLLILLALGGMVLWGWVFSAAFKNQSTDLLLAKAVSRAEAKDWSPSLEAFQQAAKQSPDDREVDYFRAAVLLRREEPQDAQTALDLLRRVGKVSPDFAQVRVLQVEALRRLGRPGEAEKEWDEAVRRDGALLRGDPRFVRVQDLMRNGRNAEALTLLDGLVKVCPEHFGLRLFRGVVLEGLGRHDEARREIDQALEVWPDNVDALVRLGYVALAQKDRSGSTYALRRLQRLAPDDARTKALASAVKPDP